MLTSPFINFVFESLTGFSFENGFGRFEAVGYSSEQATGSIL
jgi:hypothetical protein